MSNYFMKYLELINILLLCEFAKSLQTNILTVFSFHPHVPNSCCPPGAQHTLQICSARIRVTWHSCAHAYRKWFMSRFFWFTKRMIHWLAECGEEELSSTHVNGCRVEVSFLLIKWIKISMPYFIFGGGTEMIKYNGWYPVTWQWELWAVL